MYKQSFDIYFEKDQKQTGSPWILDEPSWIERPAAARQLLQNFKMSDKLNRWESLLERVREGALIIARAVNRIITVSRLFITQPWT